MIKRQVNLIHQHVGPNGLGNLNYLLQEILVQNGPRWVVGVVQADHLGVWLNQFQAKNEKTGDF